jgi:hypothetical protein
VSEIVVVYEPVTSVVVVEEPELVAVTAPGPQGPPGPTGPQGPAGPAGGGAIFIYEQTTAAPVWTIDHGRGRVPSAIYVEEYTGDDLEPGRSDPSVNQTVLDFNGTAVSGIAYIP